MKTVVDGSVMGSANTNSLAKAEKMHKSYYYSDDDDDDGCLKVDAKKGVKSASKKPQLEKDKGYR